MRLVGRITNLIDLGVGSINGVVATEDGKKFTFEECDSAIAPEDLTVDLRVSFEEGAIAGEAKHVRYFSVEPAPGRPVVSVTVDDIKYAPLRYGADSCVDGVEVFYSYLVEKGWRNCSRDMVPAGYSGDFFGSTPRVPGHTDFGRSPNVSVFHSRSGADSWTDDAVDVVCDGVWQHITAFVRFGRDENVKVGAEVSVRVALRVATGGLGDDMVEEAIARRTLTITEKSDARQAVRRSAGPASPAKSNWA